MFDSRTESANQFRAHTSDRLLTVFQVFEAPISIENGPELITTFYTIGNGKQSLLGLGMAILFK